MGRWAYRAVSLRTRQPLPRRLIVFPSFICPRRRGRRRRKEGAPIGVVNSSQQHRIEEFILGRRHSAADAIRCCRRWQSI